MGGADNERFLEHFQFHIIASQLLTDNIGPVSAHASSQAHVDEQRPLSQVYSANTTGAACAAGTAFAFVWMLHWVRHGAVPAPVTWRISIALCVTLCLVAGLYAYIARQWLQHLRRNAINAVASFIDNLQSFEASSTSLLGLIQEVELVARGYRMWVFASLREMECHC